MSATIPELALSWLAAIAITQAASPDDRLAGSRAVEAAIWGMPAVNYDLSFRSQSSTTSIRSKGSMGLMHEGVDR